MNKPLIISDKNIKSVQIKKQIINLFKRKKIFKKNIVLVVGGDGFMLKTLKKNQKTKKLFYGINSGNYGFLMNKFSKKQLIQNIQKSKMISISPLEMIVVSKNKTIFYSGGDIEKISSLFILLRAFEMIFDLPIWN